MYTIDFQYKISTHQFSYVRYLDAIERAVANGDCLMLENIMESVDPVLDPLLGRLTIKKGKYIKIGDKEVEYHPQFRLILQVSSLVAPSNVFRWLCYLKFCLFTD